MVHWPWVKTYAFRAYALMQLTFVCWLTLKSLTRALVSEQTKFKTSVDCADDKMYAVRTVFLHKKINLIQSTIDTFCKYGLPSGPLFANTRDANVVHVDQPTVLMIQLNHVDHPLVGRRTWKLEWRLKYLAHVHYPVDICFLTFKSHVRALLSMKIHNSGCMQTLWTDISRLSWCQNLH